jgi:osmotically-inducible protein OsmY
MKKHLFTILFVLCLSAAVAFAQAAAPNADTPVQGTKTTAPEGPAHSASTPQTDQTMDQKTSSMANVDDESLHRQVHEQLAANPELQNVQITVKNGVVTLDGSVPNKTDKKEAKKLAKSVPGVKSVKEHLTINSAASSASMGTTGGTTGAAANTGAATGANAQSGTGIAAQSSTSSTTGTTSAATETGQAGVAAGTSAPSSSASSSANPPSSSEPAPQSSASAASPSGQTSATAGATTPSTAAPSSSTPDQSAASAQAQTGTSAGATSSTGGVSGQATSQSSVPSGQESTQPAVGSQAGSAAPSTSTGSATAQSSGTMSAAGSDDQLQQQIMTALKNEPTLSNDHVNVNVSADSIELSGDVTSGKEKKTAKRIAESYAGNRKVVDHITVNGKGGEMSNPSTPPSSSDNPKPPQE